MVQYGLFEFIRRIGVSVIHQEPLLDLARQLIQGIKYLHKNGKTAKNLGVEFLCFLMTIIPLTRSVMIFKDSSLRAPEEIGVDYDVESADWYRLGLILFYCLFGRGGEARLPSLLLHEIYTEQELWLFDQGVAEKPFVLEHSTYYRYQDKLTYELDEIHLFNEARDLLESLLDFHANGRCEISSSIETHPFFWDGSKKLKFLDAVNKRRSKKEMRDCISEAEGPVLQGEDWKAKVHQDFVSQMEIKANSLKANSLTDLLQGEDSETKDHEDFVTRIETKASSLRDLLQGEDWKTKDHEVFVTKMATKATPYNGSSLKDLIRFIRNADHHAEESLTTEMLVWLDEQGGLIKYFEDEFSGLIITLYKKIKKHGMADQFPMFM